jgi:septal ring factor EnvC (AmiA/AmiB activator)
MLVYKSIEQVQQEYHQQNTDSNIHGQQTHKNNTNINNNKSNQPQLNHSLPNLNHKLIEKSIKVYRTHHNAKDFNDKFVRSLGLYDEEVMFVKAVVSSKMKTSF